MDLNVRENNSRKSAIKKNFHQVVSKLLKIYGVSGMILAIYDKSDIE